MMWNSKPGSFLAIAALVACCAVLPAARAQSADAGRKMLSPAKACPRIANPDALRALAQDCAKDLAHDANCRAFAKDANEGYVIVRDCSPKKPDAYLMIPVKPVTGIEDAQVLSAPLADLWEDAWRWSRKYPGEAAARTGLAVNSKNARSQNQLHIHISCVLPKVSEALESGNIPPYPAKPVALVLGPEKTVYEAVKVTGLAGENSPFRVIQSFPGVAGDMKDQSIAVIGSQKVAEYYVLNTTAGSAGRGHAEELLEQTCAPAR